MNSEGTDAGGGAGGAGGDEGAEGKGSDDEAVVLSAEYIEMAAMAEQAAFDVNTSRCSDGNPPIFFAVRALSREAPAHEDCLVLVLGLKGVDVNLQDKHGATALRTAAFKGAWRCVKVLLADHRIDVNLPDNEGRTPLHTAVDQGRIKCVKLLLQAPGIKINKVNSLGRTPLVVAANLGKLECLKLLLQADGIAVNKDVRWG